MFVPAPGSEGRISHGVDRASNRLYNDCNLTLLRTARGFINAAAFGASSLTILDIHSDLQAQRMQSKFRVTFLSLTPFYVFIIVGQSQIYFFVLGNKLKYSFQLFSLKLYFFHTFKSSQFAISETTSAEMNYRNELLFSKRSLQYYNLNRSILSIIVNMKISNEALSRPLAILYNVAIENDFQNVPGDEKKLYSLQLMLHAIPIIINKSCLI